MTCLTLSFVAVIGSLGNIPVYSGEVGAQAAQANHNTARSNKNTVAAPETGDPGADAAPANHNTARSNKNNISGPGGGSGTGKPSVSHHTDDEPKAEKPKATPPR